jgi:hypothetical protein
MRDAIELAKEAGADTLMYWDIEKLKRFEALVRADEREACAKVCEAKHSDGRGHDAWGWLSKDYADAIRAR